MSPVDIFPWALGVYVTAVTSGVRAAFAGGAILRDRDTKIKSVRLSFMS